jgi:cell division protein ZapA
LEVLVDFKGKIGLNCRKINKNRNPGNSMTAVTIKVNGRDYRVACDDGQEDHLRLLADEVDDRIRSLIFGMDNNPAEGMALLMAALTMADELIELKRENEKLMALGDTEAPPVGEDRVREMEAAMAATLDEIAHRIEKIADQVEIG